MRNCITFNMFYEMLLFSFLLLGSMSAGAGVDEYRQGQEWRAGSAVPLYVAETNPWLVPEKPVAENGFVRHPHPLYDVDNKSSSRYKSRDFNPGHYVPENDDKHLYQGGRFVTPEVLESLKHQQMYFQQAPVQPAPGYRQPDSKQNSWRSQSPANNYPAIPSAGKNYPDTYSYPSYGSMTENPATASNRNPVNGRYNNNDSILNDSVTNYGMNNNNPLYDVPLVSPWGNSPDVLYRGESFPGTIPGTFSDTFAGSYPDNMPWLPSEAMGGLPPIQMPSYGYDGAAPGYYEPEPDMYNPADPDGYVRGNEFNPLNFMPNGKMR